MSLIILDIVNIPEFTSVTHCWYNTVNIPLTATFDVIYTDKDLHVTNKQSQCDIFNIFLRQYFSLSDWQLYPDAFLEYVECYAG